MAGDFQGIIMSISIVIYLIFAIGVFPALPMEDKTISCLIARIFVSLIWPIYLIHIIIKKIQK